MKCALLNVKKKFLFAFIALSLIFAFSVSVLAAPKPTYDKDMIGTLPMGTYTIVGDIIMNGLSQSAVFKAVAIAEKKGLDSDVYFMRANMPINRRGFFNLTEIYSDAAGGINCTSIADGIDIYSRVKYVMDTATKEISAYDGLAPATTSIQVKEDFKGLVTLESKTLTVPKGCNTITFISNAIESTDLSKQEYAFSVTTLTVTAENGTTTTTYQVATKDLTETEKVAVEDVNVNPTTDMLAVDQKLELKAFVIPQRATNTAVTWSSSDTAVATVEATTGIVTAIGAGEVDITVKTEESGKEAVAHIKVLRKEDYKEDVDYSITRNNINLGWLDMTFFVIKADSVKEINTNYGTPKRQIHNPNEWRLAVEGNVAVTEITVTVTKTN